MAVFWRINSNELTPLFETQALGFSSKDPSLIPDEYLEQKHFIVFRTCHSIGDWGIISAFPRLLKQKYPDCKVYLPSPELLRHMFRHFNSWGHWKDPFNNVQLVFQNNPYVDGYIDDISEEVFHDHYRVYDEAQPETSLILQMLRFWQFEDHEIGDHLPELHFSTSEIEEGDRIISQFTNGKFGTLLLTNTVSDYYPDEINHKLLNEIKLQKTIPYFYYGNRSIPETIFKDISYIDLKTLNLPIRIQLYLKTKALINIGYQSGVNDTVCRYTQVVSTPSTGNLGADYLKAIKYLR